MNVCTIGAIGFKIEKDDHVYVIVESTDGLEQEEYGIGLTIDQLFTHLQELKDTNR